MNETARTLDLAAETGGSHVLELVAIGIVAVLAFAYLARGFMRKRRRTLDGGGCGECAGCGSSGGTCHVPDFTVPENTGPENTRTTNLTTKEKTP